MNKLGLIAGGGNFPVLIAKQAKKNGYEIYTAALKGTAEERLKNFSKEIVFLKFGRLTAAINFFKSHKIDKVLLAGLIKHSSIFDIMPDMRAAKILASLKDTKAQTIFNAARAEFKKERIEFADTGEFLKGYLAGEGVLTKKKPDKNQIKNIKLGWKTAKTLADLDAGLTAVTADGAVVALEAMEGTDECILRAGKIYGSADQSKKNSGLVVVKVARSKQDMRFDLPVIGTQTITSMLASDARTLAIEADKTLFLDKDQTIKLANEKKIAIVGLKDCSAV